MSPFGRAHPDCKLPAVPTVLPHAPTRGSDVEAWIKSFRDRRPKTSPWFVTLDRLLDDYRLRADTGLPLAADISEAGGS